MEAAPKEIEEVHWLPGLKLRSKTLKNPSSKETTRMCLTTTTQELQKVLGTPKISKVYQDHDSRDLAVLIR